MQYLKLKETNECFIRWQAMDSMCPILLNDSQIYLYIVNRKIHVILSVLLLLNTNRLHIHIATIFEIFLF